MALSPEKFKEIEDALRQAYNEAELRRMVRLGFDENLDNIAGGRNLSELRFNLIDWAERTGRELDLVRCAYEHNQGNRALQQLYSKWRGLSIDFDWVTIPAGEFFMGSDDAKEIFEHETPKHRVLLSKYQIARVPVTVAQFTQFVEATSYKTEAEIVGTGWAYNGKEFERVKGVDWAHSVGLDCHVDRKQEHPVIQLSWHDAQAFCEWANVRLPTEAEWEKAARGTDGRIWPWGNERPTYEHCNFERIVGDTTPVGAYPAGASPYGLLDVAGNVWELTADWYDSSFYANSPVENPKGPTEGDVRTLRGGSWDSGEDAVRCAYRNFDIANDDGWYDPYGFRVVRLDNHGV